VGVWSLFSACDRIKNLGIFIERRESVNTTTISFRPCLQRIFESLLPANRMAKSEYESNEALDESRGEERRNVNERG